jgi:hypothetical protein
MKSSYNKIPTKEQYQHMVRNMPTKELEGLAETFNQSTSVNTVEALIRDVINAEMENRIMMWEAQ